MEAFEKKEGDLLIPCTLFNQPLFGGTFQDERMVSDQNVPNVNIHVGNDYLHISELQVQNYLFLLKMLFKEKSEAIVALASGEKALIIAAFREFLKPRLLIETSASLGMMLSQLGNRFSLIPLLKMAGLNGMLAPSPSVMPPVCKMTEAPASLCEAWSVIDDPSIPDFALVTTYKKLTGIQSEIVCHCSLDPLPTLTIADKLSLYYRYFRRQEIDYAIAGHQLCISSDEMSVLDEKVKQIMGGSE
jgi:hypothetical protein